jgi:dTDP-4-dehydrorhamnose 3,5-epimerase
VNVFEEFEQTRIPGCYLIRPWRRPDERGLFVKTFHTEAFRERGLQTDFRESYFSVSRKGVLRGMHFQRPPHEHAKLVYCVMGCVLDAVVDLRSDRGGFGKHQEFELSDRNSCILYLSPGVAHGFYVLSEEAITVYSVTGEYNPGSDSGVRWNSCGVDWPTDSPVVSPRDSNFPLIEDARNIFGAPVAGVHRHSCPK